MFSPLPLLQISLPLLALALFVGNSVHPVFPDSMHHQLQPMRPLIQNIIPFLQLTDSVQEMINFLIALFEILFQTVVCLQGMDQLQSEVLDYVLEFIDEW